MIKRTDSKDVFDQIVEEMTANTPPGEPITRNGHKPTKAAPTGIDRPGANEPADGEDEDAQPDRAVDVDVDDGVGEGDEAARDAADPAPGDTDGEQQTTWRSRRIVRQLVRGAVGVGLIAIVGAAAFLGWQLKQRADVAAAEQSALDAARNYAVTLSTVDSSHIDTNINQVLDGATGDFKSMYSQASAQLRQLLVDNKAVSRGTVVDSGIKSGSKDKVDVMLFLDQSVTNAVNPDPRIDRLRVVMTMERVDNRWLASKFDIE